MLKGQDIGLIIKLLLKQQSSQIIEHTILAYELHISQSEVSKGMLRLEKASLISRYEDKIIEIHKHALLEMLVYGLKYFMGAELNIEQRGIPTAYSSPYLIKELVSKDSYVWPHINGQSKGLALTPLYKTLPHALYKFPDDDFYKIMSIIELLRLGGSREITIARKILEEILWP